MLMDTSTLVIASSVSWSTIEMLTEISAASKFSGAEVTSATSVDTATVALLAFYFMK